MWPLLIILLLAGCEGRALQYVRDHGSVDQFANDDMHCEREHYRDRTEPIIFTIHPESSIGFSRSRDSMYLDTDWDAVDKCLLDKGWKHPQ